MVHLINRLSNFYVAGWGRLVVTHMLNNLRPLRTCVIVVAVCFEFSLCASLIATERPKDITISSALRDMVNRTMHV